MDLSGARLFMLGLTVTLVAGSAVATAYYVSLGSAQGPGLPPEAAPREPSPQPVAAHDATPDDGLAHETNASGGAGAPPSAPHAPTPKPPATTTSKPPVRTNLTNHTRTNATNTSSNATRSNTSHNDTGTGGGSNGGPGVPLPDPGVGGGGLPGGDLPTGELPTGDLPIQPPVDQPPVETPPTDTPPVDTLPVDTSGATQGVTDVLPSPDLTPNPPSIEAAATDPSGTLGAATTSAQENATTIANDSTAPVQGASAPAVPSTNPANAGLPGIRLF